MEHILTILIFFPALAAVLGFMINENIKTYGVVVAAIELLLSLALWVMFDNNEA